MEVWRDLAEFARNPVEKPYVTVGFFDGVHLGHRAILDELREMAELGAGASVVFTFVAPTSNDWRAEALNYTGERLEKLAATGIDGVLLIDFGDDLQRLDASSFIEEYVVNGLAAAGVCVGYDHRFGRGGAGDFSTVAAMGKKHGFEVRAAAPLAVGGRVISSTFIRRRLKDGDVAAAARLLGYKYEIEGIVVPGDGIAGPELGYPTANLKPKRKLLPGYGVYAALVYVGNEQFESARSCSDGEGGHPRAGTSIPDGSYGGFVNVGTRPTVSNSGASSTEVHLFGYEGNLVGETVRIAFVDFIREERKFTGLAELKQQLVVDEAAARKILHATETA
ncbi:MAG: bifunctional riboflavin kinase/FMN adenylyltransferase [Candidatus Coatesbacteria bacterium]|nr:MAG: bifunctional riboflavin kinase/FMN adenylyltransferase [Candidatus Coatesbacteria bacterium]